MSLLEDTRTKCIIINSILVDDGIGGYKRSYSEGVTFDASIVFDSSLQGQTAMANGVTGLYTVTTQKKLTLMYHDIFKELATGKIFRVTTDGTDAKTPKSAGLDMRQVRAEEWELTDDD